MGVNWKTGAMQTRLVCVLVLECTIDGTRDITTVTNNRVITSKID